MTYKEIIEDNCQNNSEIDWWPKYAFHYTDVTNAVSILDEGYIYSRYDASEKSLMINDNASRQVIDMTYSGALSDVRFYFRPLTPTQYHNEGFKHPSLRYCGDLNANVPVPVFFMFDLNSILQLPETRFSGQSLAGFGVDVYSGEENFGKMDFRQIYKIGSMQNVELEKKYRQAEIIYPNAFSIKESLCNIVCRNDIERATLLNLLRRENKKAFMQYKDYIVVNKDCFENNGLYITQCNYYADRIAVAYSQTANKRNYTGKYRNATDSKLIVDACADLKWVHSSTVILHQRCKFALDYENRDNTIFTNICKPDGATALYMKIFFEEKLMCYVCWQLAESALL
ncbi:MAG: DUF4433 domain-containing protein [Butyrivibrio sp.]|jgi:hypothetical protein|nr:DUF4433 domain-containing protein [Butyrivibrio sp.]